LQWLRALFSAEARATWLENQLKRANQAGDQKKIQVLYCKLFVLLLKQEEADQLSNLVLTYAPIIDISSWVKVGISSTSMRLALIMLEENGLDTAALAISDYGGYEEKAIELLAKRGDVDELTARIINGNVVDKKMLRTAVDVWEQYHGDIRMSPRMSHMMCLIATFSPESLPRNPRVIESSGQYEQAAGLYAKTEDFLNAANCYEKAEMFEQAFKLYQGLGNSEGISRMAESLGNLEDALQFAVNPERRFNLLLKMERFPEACELAAKFESWDDHIDAIRIRAREVIQYRIKEHDFVGAMALTDLAEYTRVDREKILKLSHEYFDRELATAESSEKIQSIIRDRIELEEQAGHFKEAGRLAEEVLKDMELASLLYEKAELFHKAIGTATEPLRLAELHEKGGNLLRAAQLYESAGHYDKAFEIYEELNNFVKALECYQKTINPSRDVLIRLYIGAGQFKKAVETYAESGEFSDLEKALSLAKTHGLMTHERILRKKMETLITGSKSDLIKVYGQAKAEVLSTYSPVLGIDFGTTNSVVALFNKISGKVEIVSTPYGIPYEPSFFGVDKQGRLIFGQAARLQNLTEPDSVVSHAKRRLGDGVTFLVRGNSYHCEQIVGSFLQHLKSNAEAYIQSKVEVKFQERLNSQSLKFPIDMLKTFLKKQGKPIHYEDVVLSVPAYFNDNQKRATRDSAEIAGLRVRRLLHEPTSAALAYSYQKSYSGKLAVIDLGGGTLDISILDIGEGVNQVLTVGGDTKLGGSDIDGLLMERVAGDIKDRWGITINEKTHPIELARLRDSCEKLKIELSSINKATMELKYFLNRPRYAFTMTRTELEKLSQSVLDRIRSTIEKTIKTYGSNIDNLILVGNATKMPAVRKLVKRTIPATELRGIDPGAVVATGAALEGSILCGDLTQTLLLDIVPYSLGIVVVSETGDEKINTLIKGESTIPTQNSGVFTTKEDSQPNVHIRVYQGESVSPDKNYFLGDFILEGIPPAPAHVPQIEVTFKIGADCVLTVTAVDKATGNERSIRIENSVLLSPEEKQSLIRFFAQREKRHDIERDMNELRQEIDDLNLSCEKIITTAETQLKDFFTQYSEKIEANPDLYKADSNQFEAIQKMIINKDRFRHGIPMFRDRFATLLARLQEIDSDPLDFSIDEIDSQVRKKMNDLFRYKKDLNTLIESIQVGATSIVSEWIRVLDSMEPNLSRMDPLKMAKYYITLGSADEAREILESMDATDEGINQEGFHLLLDCYASLGLRDEYRDAHRQFGGLFGIVYPDFARLDSYLKAIDESIFMISMKSEGYKASGTSFCLAPHVVITNRHVVEDINPEQLSIIGKKATYHVNKIELDPIHDLAVLRVSENLKPLRLGKFDFVEPGEQIMAIGFPTPSSSVHHENIYISKGIVNSIRRTEFSPERVIFVDTKIGRGMSGGPLINDLGEVVGIVTLKWYGGSLTDTGMVLIEDQPVALPIHLISKYLNDNHS